MSDQIQGSNVPYVIVPQGVHLLELLKYNSRKVVAVIDHRANGTLQKIGVDNFDGDFFEIGQELPWPFFSILNNRNYYKKLASELDRLIEKHDGCKFILTSNYIPFTRFIIDYVGTDRIEFWEDGLNHYLKLESLSKKYLLKELVKLSAGFYSKGIFDSNYRGSELKTYDRFKSQNLSYPVAQLSSGEKFYIGQPLIEDNLITEQEYKAKLAAFFKEVDVNYLPHPREKPREWISQLFRVVETNLSAERYLQEKGASAVYSAFSTVNVNVSCQTNIFLADYLGLNKIASRLSGLKFDVELV